MLQDRDGAIPSQEKGCESDDSESMRSTAGVIGKILISFLLLHIELVDHSQL